MSYNTHTSTVHYVHMLVVTEICFRLIGGAIVTMGVPQSNDGQQHLLFINVLNRRVI